jgi:hypothetical protein
MRRVWIFCLCLGLASCSGNPYGDHPPYPVSGQVLVNGQPAKGVRVTFFHSGDWGERAIVPQSWTDDQGRFELATYGVKDGAPAGDYRVTAEWPAYRHGKSWGPDKFGGRYTKPETSGLTAHVDKGGNKLEPFALQVSAAQARLNETLDAQAAHKKKER